MDGDRVGGKERRNWVSRHINQAAVNVKSKENQKLFCLTWEAQILSNFMVSSVKNGQQQCSDAQKMKLRYRTINYVPLGISQVTMLHFSWEHDLPQFRTLLCGTCTTGNCCSYALQMLMKSLMNREESYIFLVIAFL